MSLRVGGARIAARRRAQPLSTRNALPALSPSHRPTRLASTASPSSSPLEGETQRTNPAPGPPKPNSPFTIFDRAAKVLQRNRAATKAGAGPEGGERGGPSRITDYVRMAAAENVAERLLDIKRNFHTVVEVGSGPGYLRHHLDAAGTGVKKIIMCDSSREMLYRDEDLDDQFPFEIERRVIDEEELPFHADSLECVVSSGALHWTNDLPGALIQIQRSLKPDGVFLGAMYGGDTLFELRTSLQLAEQEREGGISPRVSPMTDTRDCASLLSRAGFSIPTVDIDEVTVAYPSIYELMHDLRDMGESNAVINRRPLLRRDTLLSAGAIYHALHGFEDGTVPATYGIIYLIGWKPDASQAKPLERGSAQRSLKDVLDSGSNSPEGPPPQGGVPPPPGGGKTRSFSTSARARRGPPQSQSQLRPDPQTKTKACPACGTPQPLENIACPAPSCGHLQLLPSSLDYYTLLGFPAPSLSSSPSSSSSSSSAAASPIPQRGFAIDLQALKSAWRKRQAVSHPDRMASRSEREQAIAAQQSTAINRAYEVLADPLLRAHYLLQLAAQAQVDAGRDAAAGVSAGARADADAVPETAKLSDPSFLMEVMDLHSALEEASSEGDVEPVRAATEENLAGSVAALGRAFEGGEWEAARSEVVKLKYWVNLRRAVQEWVPGGKVELPH